MQLCTKSCHAFGSFEELTVGKGIIEKTRKIQTRESRKPNAILSNRKIQFSGYSTRQVSVIFYDSSIHRTSEPSMQRSIEPVIYRSIDPWNQRSIDPTIHRTIEPAIYRSNDPSNQRSIDPSNHRTIDLLIQQSNDPSIYRTTDLSNHQTIKRKNFTYSDSDMSNPVPAK